MKSIIIISLFALLIEGVTAQSTPCIASNGYCAAILLSFDSDYYSAQIFTAKQNAGLYEIPDNELLSIGTPGSGERGDAAITVPGSCDNPEYCVQQPQDVIDANDIYALCYCPPGEGCGL